jgi:3-dehydroquinate dehydratase II
VLVDLIQSARTGHISNIHARDQLDRHSKLSSAVTAVIAGLGPFVAMQLPA